jgi:hypothetical protein
MKSRRSRDRESWFNVLMLVLLVVVALACRRTPETKPQEPATGVLLQEDFSERQPGWRQARGQWDVSQDRPHRLLQILDDDKQLNALFFYQPLIVADAEVTVMAAVMPRLPRFPTALPEDAQLMLTRRRIAGAGIVFRYQDEDNYYMFRIAGEDGVVLGKMVAGEWKDIANPRAVEFMGGRIQMDTAYKLRVRFRGTNIQAWFDDKAVANISDSSFTTGKIGLTTFKSQGTFSDLLVVER